MIKNEQWYKEQHEKMWHWLADNPTKEKDEWSGWRDLDKEFTEGGFLCFACYWAEKCALDEGGDCIDMCTYCPCWENIDNYYECEKGNFGRWCELSSEYDGENIEWTEEDLRERTILALEIKNMWRKVDE